MISLNRIGDIYMDYTFIFKISKDSISINKTTRTIDKKGLNNTNVIDTKELKFSPEYIKENSDLVSTFINVIILKNNITTCIINTDTYVDTLVGLVNNWDKITRLVFKQDITLNYDVFLKLLDNNHLITMECYNMPTYLMERLDMVKKVKITMREQKNFASRFMKENLLNTYTDIYYKRSIILTSDYNEKEYEVIKNFIAINNKLRTIRIIKYTNENLLEILNTLQMYKKKNIQIIIDENNNDLDVIFKTVTFVKKNYKKFITDNNITFKINYSFDYKKKNFLKEFNLKILTTIILIVIIIVLLLLGYNSYIEYKDSGVIETQMSEIEEIINQYTIPEPDYIDPDDDNPEGQQPATPGYESPYYVNYSRVFDELANINPDTVAWIKVNNTRIDYPVVQSNNNTFYLWRDFKKNKNSMGWIFMDYRNDPENLNQNTILYGHNVKGGIMFGTMGSMFNRSYLAKEQNNYITLNTKKANMKFKIFSMYRIASTTDYLSTEFYSKDTYRDFINMIQSRSEFPFNVEVNENDKIITLSTCHSNTTRNVIHAKLVEVVDNIPEPEPVVEPAPDVQEPETEPTTEAQVEENNTTEENIETNTEE